jgi:hypothetical protein
MAAKVSEAMARQLGLESTRTHKRGQAKIVAMSGLFEAACVAHGLMEPVPEYCFAPPRLFRFDWAWPEKSTCLEVEGGIWAGKPCHVCGMRRGGRHNSGQGMENDIEKYNLAVLEGWRVLRCTPQDVQNGKVFALLKRAFAAKN